MPIALHWRMQLWPCSGAPRALQARARLGALRLRDSSDFDGCSLRPQTVEDRFVVVGQLHDGITLFDLRPLLHEPLFDAPRDGRLDGLLALIGCVGEHAPASTDVLRPGSEKRGEGKREKDGNQDSGDHNRSPWRGHTQGLRKRVPLEARPVLGVDRCLFHAASPSRLTVSEM